MTENPGQGSKDEDRREGYKKPWQHECAHAPLTAQVEQEMQEAADQEANADHDQVRPGKIIRVFVSK